MEEWKNGRMEEVMILPFLPYHGWEIPSLNPMALT
jgi:hypothetical protein